MYRGWQGVGLLLASVSLGILHDNAHGQTFAMQAHCEEFQPAPTEVLGTQAGVSVQTLRASCVVEGGPLDGADMITRIVYEINDTEARLVTGHADYQKADATAVTEDFEGTMRLATTDGQATGWAAEGTNLVKSATGSASSLAGLRLNWTARPAGGSEGFVIEAHVE